MATTTPQPPSDSPTGFTPSPPPSPSSSNGQSQGSATIPPISLCLYIFSVTLILFMMILGAFVSRSLRRRRRRSAAALTALTTGDYGRVTGFRGKFDKLPASKPTLWETRMIPVDDEAKGWVGIFPVAGATMVPVTEAPDRDVKVHRLASWRSRLHFSPRRTDPSPTIDSMEPPASSPVPTNLTFLVSMPTTPAHTKAGQGNGGPPVVELGVAQVSCTPNVTR